MYILEERYGNDGYAFFFKLLESIADADGHVLDFNDGTEWEFFVAKTRTSESFCTEILDLLAKLKKIDPDLWRKRVVWYQGFVDGVAPVYKKRHTETPTKPGFCDENPPIAPVPDPKTPPLSRESRVEKSRVEESREKKEVPPVPGDSLPLLNHLTCKRNGKAVQAFRVGVNVRLAKGEYERMVDDWGIDFTRSAVKEYDQLFPNRPALKKHTDHNAAIRDYVKRGYICVGKTPSPKYQGEKPPAVSEEELGDPEERAELIRKHLPFRLQRGREVQQVGAVMENMGSGP